MMRPHAFYHKQSLNSPTLFPVEQTTDDHQKGKATCQLCDQVTYAKIRYTSTGASFWDFSEHFQSYCHVQAGMRDVPGAVWNHEAASWTVLEKDPVDDNMEAEKFVEQPFPAYKPSVQEDCYKESKPDHTLPVQQGFQASNCFDCKPCKEISDRFPNYMAENLGGPLLAQKTVMKNLPIEQAAEVQNFGLHNTVGGHHLVAQMISCMYCDQEVVMISELGDDFMQHLLCACPDFKLVRR